MCTNTHKLGYTSRTGTLKKKIVADFREDSHEDCLSNANHLNGLDNQHLKDRLQTNDQLKQTNDQSVLNQQNNLPSQPTKQDFKRIRDEMRRIGLNDEIEINGEQNDFDENSFPNWQESCPLGRVGEIKKIDMKVIEPYTRVVSHAGYYTNRSDQSIGGRTINLTSFFLFFLLFIFFFYKTLN